MEFSQSEIDQYNNQELIDEEVGKTINGYCGGNFNFEDIAKIRAELHPIIFDKLIDYGYGETIFEDISKFKVTDQKKLKAKLSVMTEILKKKKIRKEIIYKIKDRLLEEKDILNSLFIIAHEEYNQGKTEKYNYVIEKAKEWARFGVYEYKQKINSEVPINLARIARFQFDSKDFSHYSDTLIEALELVKKMSLENDDDKKIKKETENKVMKIYDEIAKIEAIHEAE